MGDRFPSSAKSESSKLSKGKLLSPSGRTLLNRIGGYRILRSTRGSHSPSPASRCNRGRSYLGNDTREDIRNFIVSRVASQLPDSPLLTRDLVDNELVTATSLLSKFTGQAGIYHNARKELVSSNASARGSLRAKLDYLSN